MNHIYQPIALIGLSGAGKSTIGELLAEKTNSTFIDTDEVIEKTIGQTISTYFSTQGEAAFRKLEKQVLCDLLSCPQYQIIATGGGCILDSENRRLLKEKTNVVYLEVSVEQLVLRLKNDQQRPLLAEGDLHVRLTELCQQRKALYEETAHFTIDPSVNGAEQITQQIIDHFELVK